MKNLVRPKSCHCQSSSITLKCLNIMSANVDFRNLQRSSNRDARRMYQQAEEITKGTISTTYGGIGKAFVNKLRLKYNLTQFQMSVLTSIQHQWEQLAQKLDPTRVDGIDDIKDAMTEDDELILYRDSSKGLIKLTIHEEELVTYTRLGKRKEDDLLEFNEASKDIDFESIAYKILCK